jgi:hypothetical protein
MLGDRLPGDLLQQLIQLGGQRFVANAFQRRRRRQTDRTAPVDLRVVAIADEDRQRRLGVPDGVGERSANLLVIALPLLVDWSTCTPALAQAEVTTEAFAQEVKRVLPEQKLYDYHKRLSEGPVHVARRDAEARKQPSDRYELRSRP